MPKIIAFTEKEVAAIEAMAGYGLKMKQIADVLKMDKRTLERKMKKTNKELGAFAARDRGKSIAILEVSKSFYQVAKSGKNPSASLSWLKCRAGWNEKGEEENEKDKSDTQVNIIWQELPRDKKSYFDK